MWHLIFSNHKLNTASSSIFRDLWMITLVIVTCGSILAELGLGKDFKDVEIRYHACDDVIEKLYYSAGLEPTVELHDQPFTSEDHYPQCEACSNREPIKVCFAHSLCNIPISVYYSFATCQLINVSYFR